jgi:hypothetical protein
MRKDDSAKIPILAPEAAQGAEGLADYDAEQKESHIYLSSNFYDGAAAIFNLRNTRRTWASCAAIVRRRFTTRAG